jgi:CYTH domain-containing protein
VNLYRYGVTIQTPEGDTVRVRVSQDQLQLAAYGDLISGEVERDH